MSCYTGTKHKHLDTLMSYHIGFFNSYESKVLKCHGCLNFTVNLKKSV